MFQNSFQNGNYFELYDPKLPQDKLKNLYKMSNVNGNNKVFDKDLKTYVLQFNSPNAKITFPKEDKKDLYLIQQYLVFQVYFYHGMSWNLELVVSDLNKTKRRIMLSPLNNKLEVKPFFVKNPTVNFEDGAWNNLSVDLYSFMEAFKGQTYRCLDSVTMVGHFKLRRIYTTNTMPVCDESEEHIESIKSINLLPKNFYFPAGVHQSSQLTRYTGEVLNLNSQINLYEPTEPSTKGANNSSYLKSTKNNRLSTPKTQTVTVKSEKNVPTKNNPNLIHQKEFLASTNGPEILKRVRKNKYHESSDSQVTDHNVNTPQSTEKKPLGITREKKKLTKTQVIPPKSRTSVEKRQKHSSKKEEQKEKIKSKLNPWRTNAKKSQTSKAIPNDDSDIGSSPNTTLFKSNHQNNKSKILNESSNKGFDRRSDHYSESEYIQLSQKFSTLTEGKFFKSSINNPNNNADTQYSNNFNPIQQNTSKYSNSFLGQQSDIQQPNGKETTDFHCQGHEQDEIQENIEMESNSMYSNSNRKEDMAIMMDIRKNELTDQSPQKRSSAFNDDLVIGESICDSLDKKSPRKQFEALARASYYGFAERLMDDYMQDRQRPFSPPIGDRDRDHVEQKNRAGHNSKDEGAKDQNEVELMYDPVLNCYYDHKTHTYYELKN